MKGFNFAVALGRSNPWTCHRCLLHARGVSRTLRQTKRYSTRTKEIPKPKKRGLVVLAATGTALGAGALAFTDDVKHGYLGVQRSGRVMGTLAVCINE
jgi:aarF domain-containing kinase